MTQDLVSRAREVMSRNDCGAYTVPTRGLYPFQWNWDSVLSAMGFAHFDEARAWTEICTLFEHQWDDGMVPHIVFHERDDGYFPGPEVWGTGRGAVPTSGITQPAVAGFVVRRMYERARDAKLAEERARHLLPRIHAWHSWMHRSRDPGGTGLAAIIHPWESGRDNSIDWDEPLSRVPTDGVDAFQRRDTEHANPDHRPTDDQYMRYIWLVQKFRSLGWDGDRLHDESPFCMVDPGFNAILIRSCVDLAALAARLEEHGVAEREREMARRGLAALESLWSERHGQHLCFDRRAGRLVESLSVGGLLTVFAPVSRDRAQALARRIEALSDSCARLVPSHDPSSPEFDGLRYWRGPAWLIVNRMIADGLEQSGANAIARRIREDSLRLIEEGGFAEYYDPRTGEPCGGGEFTWTAAMVIEMIETAREAA